MFANASGLESAKELAITTPFAIIQRCVLMKNMVLLPGEQFKSRLRLRVPVWDANEEKIGWFDKGAVDTSDYPKCSREPGTRMDPEGAYLVNAVRSFRLPKPEN